MDTGIMIGLRGARLHSCRKVADRYWASTRQIGRLRRIRFVSNSEFPRSAGFTLIELIVVMSIIAILLAIAIPTYSRSIVAARENGLRADLKQLRAGIWNYTLDKQKGPQSLDDLRSAGYIDKIPDDPMTREPNWEVVQEEVLLSIDQQDPGIIDVHSASSAIGSDNTPYNEW